MALSTRLLASGYGWRVEDVVCTFGPHDRPFEERHDWACAAIVTGGTFQYRSTAGSAVLAPGALLLGNERHCFECSHAHGVGDRCLSFHFTAEFLEAAAAVRTAAHRRRSCGATPGQRRSRIRGSRTASGRRCLRRACGRGAENSRSKPT